VSSAATEQSGYAVAPELADILAPPRRRSKTSHFLRRNPAIVAGGILLLIIVLVAMFAPWLGTVDPTAIEAIKRGRAPSAEFWFGTDMLGRDVYSRVLYGARISLIVGVSAAVLSAAIGTLIGLMSGFLRRFDAIIMRVMDGLMSVPSILLAIALMALTRASVENVVVAISVAGPTTSARLERRGGTGIDGRSDPGTVLGRLIRLIDIGNGATLRLIFWRLGCGRVGCVVHQIHSLWG
jgi:peptide/nickel transport system permease protein